MEEYESHASHSGPATAMNVKQGKYEIPDLYYLCFLCAFYGPRDEPGIEEDLYFKTMFIQNLHPSISSQPGILLDPKMPIHRLRELVAKAFYKAKPLKENQPDPCAVLEVGSNSSSLELKGSTKAKNWSANKPVIRSKKDCQRPTKR